MENTKKFLDSLKTLPTNPTSVSPVQEEESDLLDAPDKNADVVDETLAKDSNPGTDLPSDVDKDKQKGGHVEFGNLGFFSFCDQDDELDVVNNESEVPVPRLENDAVADENSQEAPEEFENVVEDNNATTEVIIPRDGNEVVINNNNQETNEPSSSNKKRTAEEDSTSLGKGKSKKKKVKGKTVNEARREVVETAKKGQKSKSSRAAKKGFKDNFQTLKFKISSINSRNGSCPDCALFGFDNVHNPDARPSAPHPGKYVTYTKGPISTQFFFKKGHFLQSQRLLSLSK